MPDLQSTIPLSLYIHLPWCIQKCPYCDFNSHTLNTNLPETEYVVALEEDFTQSLPLIQNRPISSIFFGGGTPSLFSSKSINTILNTIQKKVVLNPSLEITLEANPGTLEYKDFRGYKTAGINRISLGVQSFNNQHLKKLGRSHDQKAILEAVHKIHCAQFENFNLDLMHGLPGQTNNQSLLDLKTAVDLSPSHLSWYQLTLEPNTAFYQTPPNLPNQDLIFESQEIGKALLAKNGFWQYEVSAFSKTNFQCQHNLNYWQFGDYLGIGAGSHSKITSLTNKTITRIQKIKNPTFYRDLNKAFIHSKEILSLQSLPFEFMLNALRLSCGFNLSLLKQRTFLPVSKISTILELLITEKLALLQTKRTQIYPDLILTDLGSRFLDDVISHFL